MSLKDAQLKNSKTILSVTLSLALVYCFQHYWVVPKKLKLTEVRERVVSSRTKIAEDQLALEKLISRMPAAEEMRASQHLLDQYFKSNKQFSSVITSIVDNSKSDSFTLNRISSERQSKVSGYSQTLYNLEAEASFISIGRFLEKLEDSSLLTEVESVEITRLADEMKRCKANIKLFSYVAAGDK